MLAAILTAGIVASGAGVISRIIYHPVMPEENAYPIQVASAEGEPSEAAGSETGKVSLAALLVNGSPEAGETVAKKCAACHSFEEGGSSKIGPSLWGVVGRDIASVGGFAYSDALAAKDGAWDYDKLGGFLANPKGWAAGSKMAFAGVKKDQDLADLITYLRSISPDAPPLPEVPAEASATDGAGGAQAAATEQTQASAAEQPAEAAQDGSEEVATGGDQVAAVQPEQEQPSEQPPAAGKAEGGLGALLAAADLAAGEKVAKKCAVCHSFEQGGPNKIGPHLWSVVGRQIASVSDFSYSGALKSKEGDWNYDELDAFLTSPKEWAPGTKMAFVGIKKPEDRAAVILYLRSLSDNPEPLPQGG